jgi:hypothetical protein
VGKEIEDVKGFRLFTRISAVNVDDANINPYNAVCKLKLSGF